MHPHPPIQVIGTGPWAGAYLLQVALATPRRVRFGRFRRGEPLALAAGHYLYIGSAQGPEHNAPLLKRVSRHLQRTPPRPPQGLREEWQEFINHQGIRLAAPSPKRLHWHIDYLLDELACEVMQIVLLPSAHPIEQRLAEQIEAMPTVRPVAPGLGATDHPGHTHLLHWQGPPALPTNRIESLLSSITNEHPPACSPITG